MWITTDQAAEMYARFCKARYGANAVQVAEEKRTELRGAGDSEGERVWTKVKRHIEASN
jgi:hypothetical protein